MIALDANYPLRDKVRVGNSAPFGFANVPSLLPNLSAYVKTVDVKELKGGKRAGLNIPK